MFPDSGTSRSAWTGARFGDYRTELVILKMFDSMKSAMESGQPYETLPNPPPLAAAIPKRGLVNEPSWGQQ